MGFKVLFIFLLITIAIDCSCIKKGKYFWKDYEYKAETQSFYKIYNEGKKWIDAIRTCHLEGATLFYPKDEVEVNLIIAMREKRQENESIFIGVSDLILKGRYETIDGFSLSEVFNKWLKGEPSGGNERCLEVQHPGFLNDVNCESNKRSFVCKKTLESLQWNLKCNMQDPDYRYDESTGRCYKFHLTPKTWTDARDTCSNEKSYLAVINTRREFESLVRLTQGAKKETFMGDFVSGVVHLGFYKHGEDWLTLDGSSIDSCYGDWGYNQPDGEDQELCGSMFYNGLLNDVACNLKTFFICEHLARPLDPLVYGTKTLNATIKTPAITELPNSNKV